MVPMYKPPLVTKPPEVKVICVAEALAKVVCPATFKLEEAEIGPATFKLEAMLVEAEEIRPPLVMESKLAKYELPETFSVEEADKGPATFKLAEIEDEELEMKPVRKDKA